MASNQPPSNQLLDNPRHFDFDMSENLSDVLGESRAMTGFVGILFGFLLSASIIDKGLEPVRMFLLLFALVASASSMLLFSLPVLYHHSHFPYTKKEKFIMRSHKFMVLGFIPFGLAVFLSISLALYSSMGAWSFGVSFLVFTLLLLVYHFRKL
ncbi:Uncharacterised protein [Candidatus Gugararchaeum adminiculabundum]|nr:Uncharacterised protein [Candidatus Gugararchaeum adminiculabundum]